MKAALMNMIMTLRQIVRILMANAEGASLSTHFYMNPKHVVARWWISGFSVTCAQSGSI